MQGAAEYDIDQLGAAADAEQGNVRFQSAFDPFHFQPVALRVGFHLSLEITAVVFRADVIAPSDDQRIERSTAVGVSDTDAFGLGAGQP